jgi:hypothetical protein
MARLKSAFTQRDHFAVWKAVEIAAEMIDSEELDRHGPRRIVLEALDAGSWDDIVVDSTPRNGQEQRTSWQIKRQNVPLDEASVTKLFRDLDGLLGPTRPGDRFLFGTPAEVQFDADDGTTRSFRVLRDLCDTARKTGVNPTTLVAQGHGNEKSWCNFLKTCIGDASNEGLAAFMARLEITEIGTESDLRARAEARLQGGYRNAADLVERLFAHLVQHSDGRIEVTYPVLQAVMLASHGIREQTRLHWLRVTRSRAWEPWRISGSIPVNNVVAATWPQSSDNAIVRLCAVPQTAGDDVEAALLRLIAHRAKNIRADARDHESWVRYARRRTGGTLGFSLDCNDVGLHAQPDELPEPLGESTLPKQLAGDLQSGMSMFAWIALRERLAAILADPPSHGLDIHVDILAAMIPLWGAWELDLEADATLREHFLGMCVATNEEWRRKEFDRNVRVGQVAVDGIARAIATLLAVGTVFAGAGLTLKPAVTENGNLTVQAVTLHLVALAYASKPGSGVGAKITDAAPHFLADESGCTILAATEARPEDLELTAEGQAVPYHVSHAARADYQSSYSPKPLLTNEVAFSRALKAGPAALNELISNRFSRFAEAEWNFLQEAVEGARDNEP